MADREGFEPSVRFHVHTLSKRARSTTPPPVRIIPASQAIRKKAVFIAMSVDSATPLHQVFL